MKYAHCQKSRFRLKYLYEQHLNCFPKRDLFQQLKTTNLFQSNLHISNDYYSHQNKIHEDRCYYQELTNYLYLGHYLQSSIKPILGHYLYHISIPHLLNLDKKHEDFLIYLFAKRSHCRHRCQYQK